MSDIHGHVEYDRTSPYVHEVLDASGNVKTVYFMPPVVRGECKPLGDGWTELGYMSDEGITFSR